MKLVSSVCLARTREALHNSWDKNDPEDAQVILHMLEIGAVQFFHDPLVVGTADIQELSKTHEIVSRSKTELLHRILTHYLPLYFPEAERFHRSSRTDWFLVFLEKTGNGRAHRRLDHSRLCRPIPPDRDRRIRVVH